MRRQRRVVETRSAPSLLQHGGDKVVQGHKDLLNLSAARGNTMLRKGSSSGGVDCWETAATFVGVDSSLASHSSLTRRQRRKHAIPKQSAKNFSIFRKIKHTQRKVAQQQRMQNSVQKKADLGRTGGKQMTVDRTQAISLRQDQQQNAIIHSKDAKQNEETEQMQTRMFVARAQSEAATQATRARSTASQLAAIMQRSESAAQTAARVSQCTPRSSSKSEAVKTFAETAKAMSDAGEDWYNALVKRVADASAGSKSLQAPECGAAGTVSAEAEASSQSQEGGAAGVAGTVSSQAGRDACEVCGRAVDDHTDEQIDKCMEMDRKRSATAGARDVKQSVADEGQCEVCGRPIDEHTEAEIDRCMELEVELGKGSGGRVPAAEPIATAQTARKAKTDTPIGNGALQAKKTRFRSNAAPITSFTICENLSSRHSEYSKAARQRSNAKAKAKAAGRSVSGICRMCGKAITQHSNKETFACMRTLRKTLPELTASGAWRGDDPAGTTDSDSDGELAAVPVAVAGTAAARARYTKERAAGGAGNIDSDACEVCGRAVDDHTDEQIDKCMEMDRKRSATAGARDVKQSVADEGQCEVCGRPIDEHTEAEIDRCMELEEQVGKAPKSKSQNVPVLNMKQMKKQQRKTIGHTRKNLTCDAVRESAAKARDRSEDLNRRIDKDINNRFKLAGLMGWGGDKRADDDDDEESAALDVQAMAAKVGVEGAVVKGLRGRASDPLQQHPSGEDAGGELCEVCGRRVDDHTDEQLDKCIQMEGQEGRRLTESKGAPTEYKKVNELGEGLIGGWKGLRDALRDDDFISTLEDTTADD